MLPAMHATIVHRRHVRSTAVLLALLMLAAIAALPLRAAAEAAPGATWQAAACFVPAPDGYTMDCGFVIAPESHTAFGGRTVALATVIVRSPNPTPAPDPLVFLAGGPGAPATPLATSAPAYFGRVLQTRDVIFVDQRGTGYSQPGLYCPPLEVARLRDSGSIGAVAASEQPAIVRQQVELYTACGRAYQNAGVDLTAYNTPENAADLDDLRRALGYTQLNLFGGSYGTRLALEAMRFRPQTIRSAVLDSVAPQPYPFQVEVSASFNRTLIGLFAACDADTACAAAYPDTLARWDALVARLNDQPVQLPIVDPATGAVIDYLPLNGWDLTQTIFALAYLTEVLPVLPFVVSEADAGNYTPLSQLLSPLFQPAGDAPGLPPSAETMQTAMQCYDDLPFVTADDFIRVREANRRAQPLSLFIQFNEAYQDICANLGLGTATPAYLNEPVSSDVPSFVISGELDPITPPEQAYAAAATLSRSTVVVYPRGGHGPSGSSPCLLNAVAAFIETPTVAPDTECVADEGPFPFAVGPAAAATVQAVSVDRGWLHERP